jgi:hypothetical protein
MDVVALDELTLTFCQPDPSLTFDEFLSRAARHHLLEGLRADAPAEYLRGLRRGPQGDVVAACSLRILAAHREAIDASEAKTQLATWLDEQYANPLAAFYTRPKTRNAFEILNGFAPVAPALDEKVAETIAALKSLEGAEALRHKLMQLLNGAAGKILLKPFLPADALGDTLTNLFTAAVAIRSADDPHDVGVEGRRLAACVDEIARHVDEFSTHQGRAVLLGAVEAVQDAAKRKLELSGPPASLSFEASSRPLPLLEAGVTCSVAITVTNVGEARALDATLSVESLDDCVVAQEKPIELGLMEAQSRQQTSVSLTVAAPTTTASLLVEATWTNADHSLGRIEQTLMIAAHEVHIDWAAVAGQTPFSPYPVERPQELVGRRAQLAELASAFGADQMSNLYVTGQRRVGKTSLVRVFITEAARDPLVCVSVVELGEARAGSGPATIGRLGTKLAERLIAAAGLRDEIEVPVFVDSLAPLTDVVEQIRDWDDSLRFVFVVDEFDEIPQDTYRRDGPGDALFVPMRSLAQKPYVGWILIGGENMPFIRDEQAARLNNFSDMSLDYLPLYEDATPDQGRDFADLVRRPFPEGFLVDDAAVRTLYDESAGNPHFAKEICAALFRGAVARRDALISPEQVREAVGVAARERDVELFAHFWEDGIFELGEQQRQVELDRRHYLSGAAEVLRGGFSLTEDRLRAAARIHGLEDRTTARIDNEYIRRGILEARGAARAVHVPLFRRWLESEGIYKLPPKGISATIGERLEAQREDVRVGAGEIKRLVNSWNGFVFHGESVSRDRIDSWLEQFETAVERRVAFRLLERLRVLKEAEIFEGMRRLHRQVAQAGHIQLARGQRQLNHVFVSPIGSSGASGEAFAYKYRMANNIAVNNVVASNRLIDKLGGREDVRTVVLVDDFVGSGGTAIKALQQISQRAAELHSRSEVQWFLFAVSGTPRGAQAVADSREGRALGIRVELAFPLLDADMPFGAKSTVFSPTERVNAEHVIRKYGDRLGSNPMGYGGLSAPIVFPDNCPNNAPPILWSDANGWRPLFRRTTK